MRVNLYAKEISWFVMCIFSQCYTRVEKISAVFVVSKDVQVQSVSFDLRESLSEIQLKRMNTRMQFHLLSKNRHVK